MTVDAWTANVGIRRVGGRNKYKRRVLQIAVKTNLFAFPPTKSGKYLAYLVAPSLVSAPTLQSSYTITTPPPPKTCTVAQSYPSPSAATLDKSTAL